MHRKTAAILFACGITMFTWTLCMAEQITKPNTFSAGTPANAEEVNANFDTVYDQTNKVGSQVNIDTVNGRVGIGTATPDSKLEVNGTIHSTTGGVKFPDGTTQTTAAGTPGNRIKVAYVKDVKPSGTNGGDCTAGSWITKTLNTVEGDSNIVNLSANQFTLQPGSYAIIGSAPAYVTTSHKIALYNVTSGAFGIIGSVSHSSNTAPSVTFSELYGNISISAPTVFELQHRCSVSRAGTGFGLPASYGVSEVYSQIKITKIE